MHITLIFDSRIEWFSHFLFEKYTKQVLVIDDKNSSNFNAYDTSTRPKEYSPFLASFGLG